MTRKDLPVMGQPAPERADAARNRRRILDAAARLVAERGAEAVTMNAVAHAAGMGVGTVYRRFGDVGALLLALLDDEERRFQEAFLAGPPPLGPGAPPAERLYAFLRALTGRVADQLGIMRVAESASPMARYRSGVYLTMHTHVAVLLRQTRPDADAELLAHLLLAPFVPSLLTHLTDDLDMSRDRIAAGFDALLAGPLAGAVPGREADA